MPRSQSNCFSRVITVRSQFSALLRMSPAMMLTPPPAWHHLSGADWAAYAKRAVSAAALILGIAKGYDDPVDYEAKKQHYALVREFVDRFKEKNKSIICRELLTEASLNPESGGTPEQRSEEYYQKRPCPNLVYDAALILDEMIQHSLTSGNDN